MADELCKNNRGRHGCQNIVVDGGVEDSGYCENCYTPELAEKNEQYEEYLQKGYNHSQAALLSGLDDVTHVQVLGGEVEPDNVVAQTGTEFEVPAHRYGTTAITTPEQDAAAHNYADEDEDVDEDELEDEANTQLLDRIEQDNDRPEIELD